MRLRKDRVKLVIEAKEPIPKAPPHDMFLHYAGVVHEDENFLIDDIVSVKEIDLNTYELEAVAENYTEDLAKLFMMVASNNELLIHPDKTIPITIKKLSLSNGKAP